jgi:hypothetical protein
VRVAVTDLAGLPVPNQRLLVGSTELVTGADGTVKAPERGELAHADWPGLRVRLEEAGSLSTRLGSELTVRIAPPLPLNVRAVRLDDGVEWWVEDPRGAVLDGRALDVRTADGVRRVASKGKTREHFAPGLVTITDVATRVSAVVEVRK